MTLMEKRQLDELGLSLLTVVSGLVPPSQKRKGLAT